MCLGMGGSDKAGKRMEQQEQERQAKIAEANKRIDRAFRGFEGEQFDENAFAKAQRDFEREQQATSAQRHTAPLLPPWQQRAMEIGGPPQVPISAMLTPGRAGGPFSGGPLAGGPLAQVSGPLGQSIQAGPKPPSRDDFFFPIGDSFYDEGKQAYLGHYMPLLDKQFDDYMRQHTLRLADQGILTSSAAGRDFGDIQREYNLGQSDIGNRAVDFKNQLRGNVVNAMSDLRALAQAGVDPGSISQMATSRAQSMSELPAFDPLGDVFGQLGAQHANRMIAAQHGFGMPGQQVRAPNLTFGGRLGGGGSARNVRVVG